MNWQWTFRDDGYAIRSIKSDGYWTHIRMHRLIMGAKKGEGVDHRNGNTLDNRRANLRICSQRENVFNARVRRTPGKTSRFKGVCFCKQKKKWFSRIKKDGITYHVGFFVTQEEAARAYNRRALEVFGEYAWLNPV